MLRLITATCYGAVLLLTLLSMIGLIAAEDGRGTILAGWAVCSAAFFAIGRLAHLARREDE